VHTVGFIIRIYNDARSSERQKHRERTAALPLHEELRERATILRYTHIAYLLK